MVGDLLIGEGIWLLNLPPIKVLVRCSSAYSPWEIAKVNSSGLLVTCGPSLVLVLTVPCVGLGM
jgi:hypothetical protein